jgi:hypothetical protein
MAMLQFFERSSGGAVPVADVQVDETIQIMPANVGELIGYGLARVTEVFNGTGTATVIIVGDDGDPNRYFEDGDMDETTVGTYRGRGAGLDNAYLYTTANTIDVGFTAYTNNDGTTGIFDVWFYIARVFPH